MSLFQKKKLPADALPPAEAALSAHLRPSPFELPRVAQIPQQLAASRGAGVQEVHDALREFQILLHTRRLYHHAHPKNLESLESTYDSLHRLAHQMNGLEVRVERDGLVVPKLSEAPVPDPRGELKHLAADLQLAGIQTLILLRQFHVGELDTLTQLIRASLLKSEEVSANRRSSWWSAKLLEYGVEGIQVNGLTDRKVDTVLASLIAALVAFGGHSAGADADAPIIAPTLENLSAVLHLIARLTPPLESARGLSPEEARNRPPPAEHRFATFAARCRAAAALFGPTL